MKELKVLLSQQNQHRHDVRSLCKYVSDSDRVIDGMFRDNLLRFTQPWALNDPLEVNPAIQLTFDDNETNYTRYEYCGIIVPSYRDWVYLNLIEARYNRYGILSLTYDPFSYVMWNLYTNSHKGFLIDFGPDLDEERCFKSDSLLSGPINYVESYEIQVNKKIGAEGFQTYDHLNSELFLTKTSHWKDEREYRVIRPLSECPDYIQPTEPKSYRDSEVYLFEYDPSHIQAIVFGVSMEPDKKRRIIELTSGLQIEYCQSLLDKSQSCSLYYLPISAWGSVDRFLTMKPQIFITDGSEFQYGDRQRTITDLSELSYFRDANLKDAVLTYLRSKGLQL